MMRLFVCSVLAALLLTGCGTVTMPELDAGHPAHAGAAAASAQRPSELLTRHHPPPPIQPQDAPDDHDHLQQEDHPEMGREDGHMSHMGSEMDAMNGDEKSKMDMKHGPHGKEIQVHRHQDPRFDGQRVLPMALAGDRTVYVCPRHSDDHYSYPGTCPRCERPLQARRVSGDEAMASDADVRGSYTCTMHPEVRRAEKGLCTVCGMTLIKTEEDQ